MELAAEKGSYTHFKGSDYDTGAYFKKRNYTSERWEALAEEIHKTGLRNGYLLAVAPTSSTSIIAGTTAAVDPVMKKYFMEEKKGSMITRVAPDLNQKTFWLYKNVIPDPSDMGCRRSPASVSVIWIIRVRQPLYYKRLYLPQAFRPLYPRLGKRR